ncbi:MAG: translation initiation factor IF-2 [Arenimonas sp. SCN 70-307]|uniref:translation initiation factor IF-2 n=1 Tax=Arenimonas sp. SCN 70-307 TaxID=1660089 RepID=UPI00086E940D|nr:translation initiation factor IF-2 [Arenimonas sp. SCN 70-307]ODS62482.1 MAG: translation initiation factor IF-2 [Arenimonas sp. SCN 70-307]
MSEVTVGSLAKVLGMPVEKLLEQLAGAGMSFSGPDQVVSSTEKMKLLGFLRRTHGKDDKVTEGDAPRKITLQRRKQEELTVSAGKTKATVTVEVRQKRTYVKRDVVEEPVTDERAEALRKLEESKARNEAELAALAESDRKRQLEREAEAASRRNQEAARAAEPEYEEPAVEEPVEARAPAAPEAAPLAPGAIVIHERKPRAKAPPPPPPPAPKASAPAAKAGPKHKARGSHAMVDNEGDEGQATRFAAGQLHLSDSERARRGAAGNRKKSKVRGAEPARTGGGAHGFSRPTAPIVREVFIGDSISVADLAQKLAMKGGEVVRALFKMGVMATINQVIDHDTAVLVVEELGHKATKTADDDAETALVALQEEVQGERKPRPPVVTIMGHVDHGKTSLLDYIRRTKVASGEAGGITQHIGAYHVETEKGVISFLDTPGHSAFTSMRARGAKLTDIVVLVVAADDGVMPQTVEAVQHARAAGVPLLVAVNKMDKSDANPDNVKQGLVKLEVVPEEWGGDTQFVPVSAKTGMGIDALLDAISVQAEVMELQAVYDARATGVVIESALDKGRGPVATVLVQQGTLRKGDFLVCGVHYGRVRALFDENGKQVDSAAPSIPVQVLGLSGVPDAGDDFVVVADERLAKDVAQQRDAKKRESRLVAAAGSRMEDIMAQMGQDSGQVTLNLLVKADVQGSVEALRQALVALSNELIKINVISSGVGGITESDATLAATSKAVIIGFNVRADASARKVIETNGLDLRYFSIIYDVIDQVKQVASGLLGKEVREEIIGIAEVRDVFRSSKFGAVAGSLVIEGVVKKNKPIRVLRDNVVVFEGELESLRRFKDNVEEVRSGTECGIAVKAYNDVKPGDQIECFERIEVQRTL